MSKITDKKLIPAVLFIILLGLPAVLKPKNSGKKIEAVVLGDNAIAAYGFYLSDITENSGIRFRHFSPRLDKKIEHILPQIASTGASVAVCDYNRDGWDDLYLTNSRTDTRNALYRNNKDGTFTDVAGTLGLDELNVAGSGVSMGSVWADYDNDGFEDVFIYKWGKCELFKNVEGRKFVRQTEKNPFPEWINSNVAIWFDFDNDGFVDLFVGGYYDENIDLWHLKDTHIMPESYEYANNGGKNYLFRNTGNGRFEDVTEKFGITGSRWTLAAGAADLNHDNYPELVLANDYGIDQIFLNNEGRFFTDISKEAEIGFTPKSGMNVSFGDVDNKGELGIYISNITEPGILIQGNNLWMPFKNKPGLHYQNQARMKGIEFGGWSYGARFGDLNNDGHLDLYVANGYISAARGKSYWYDYTKVSAGNKSIISDAMNWPPMEGKSQSGYQQNKIWLNRGGVFEDVSAWVSAPMTRDSRSVVFSDLWNTGALDVIVTTQNNQPVIYRNITDSTNHWIEIKCTGVKSNRSAIGTKVVLHHNDMKQMQIVTGGSGFSSQTTRRVHFGIGRNTVIDSIEVFWPSGMIQSFSHPQPDNIYTLIEGGTLESGRS